MMTAIISALILSMAAAAEPSRSSDRSAREAYASTEIADESSHSYDFVATSRGVQIAFRVASGSGLPVTLFYRRQNAAKWQSAGDFRPGKAIPFTFDREGSYSLKLLPAEMVLIDPPDKQPGRVYRCLVDWSKPVVEILSVNYKDSSLLVHWLALDDHFSARPIEVYLVGEAGQTLLGQVSNTGWGEFKLANAKLPGRVKVAATDLAGHYSFSISELIHPTAGNVTAITTQPAEANATPRPAEVAVRTARWPSRQPVGDLTGQAKWHYRMGTQYRLQGELKLAVSHLKQAADQSPRAIGPKIDLAGVLLRLERYNESADVYGQALKLDGDLAKAWQGLGVARVRQRKLGQARQCFEKLTQLDPKRVQGWLHLGDACLMLGESEEALKHWRHARTLAREQHLKALVLAAERRFEVVAKP